MPVQLGPTLAEIENAFAHEGGVHDEQTGLIGEETLTRFESRVWFAVNVGDIIVDGRYKVLGKVANGGSSTIWFVEDTLTNMHSVLKIAIKSSNEDAKEQRAFEIIKQRAEVNSTHPGLQCLQKPLRDFIVESERTGRHHCFLLSPSPCHVEEAWRVLGDLPLYLIKEILVNVLQALDFLHTECRLIHTDLKLDNILFGFSGSDIIQDYVRQLETSPERTKIHYGRDGDEYPVTKAKPFVITKDSFSFPQLVDLGESVRIPENSDDCVAPRKVSPKAFRAPEILLERSFGSSIDIWMIGCMTLQLLTGQVPILPHGTNQPWTRAYTLAQHHALLGPPPRSFVGPDASRHYWNCLGEWTNKEHEVPNKSLGDLLASVEDAAVRAQAIDFVSCCLQWHQQDRLTAKELLKHPFLEA